MIAHHVVLDLPEKIQRDLRAHLLRKGSRTEQAAFLHARFEANDDCVTFRYVELVPVPPEGFASRTEFHFELTDQARASVIKRAHDLGTSLVEFHSHLGPWPAQFSPTDLLGLDDFVPHVWWRLKGRPYVAVVVAPSGFDGLAWIASPHNPQRLDGIVIEGRVLKPTGLTPLRSRLPNE